MPIPIIIVLVVLETISLLGIPCFIYEAKHGHIVPEMPRYAGRHKEWYAAGILQCFVLCGFGHILAHILRLRDQKKKNK